jgi:hypothetical protein
MFESHRLLRIPGINNIWMSLLLIIYSPIKNATPHWRGLQSVKKSSSTFSPVFSPPFLLNLRERSQLQNFTERFDLITLWWLLYYYSGMKSQVPRLSGELSKARKKLRCKLCLTNSRVSRKKWMRFVDCSGHNGNGNVDDDDYGPLPHVRPPQLSGSTYAAKRDSCAVRNPRCRLVDGMEKLRRFVCLPRVWRDSTPSLLPSPCRRACL